MDGLESMAILDKILREYGVNDTFNHMTDIFFVNIDDSDDKESECNTYLGFPIVM